MHPGPRLRIAVIHSFYSSRQPSGENQVVEQQVEVLTRAGHQVTLLARRTDDQEGNWAYPVRAAATVATGRGPDPLDLLDELRPDVVLVNNLFPNYGRTWVEKWDGPIVAVMHNHRPLCAPGTFFRDGASCTECLDSLTPWPAVKHGCYRDSRLATLPLALGTRFGDDPLLRRADRVVVLNPLMRALFLRAGVEDDRMVVVPNLLAPPPGSGRGGDHWLYVGRLTEEKGILPLVRDWPPGVPLTVVGAGPLEVEVARAAPDGVTMLGMQPAARVAELMQSARGLVFPSKWFEGFPMVYLEALAAGTPVIAWEPSVVSTMVREDGTGLVAGGLAATLEEADRSFPGLRGQCRSVFEAKYTRQSWLASVEGLFGVLVGAAAH
jgi:glycosyltransferase involved in cell wall biosynthesis